MAGLGAASQAGGSGGGVASSVVISSGVLTSITDPVSVTGIFFQPTQPISAASLPLPTNAATDAKQDTGNVSLGSIDVKTPALGQALAAGSVPVVLTAAQLTTLTPLSSMTVTQGTGTNLHTVVDSGTISTITNVVHVDDNGGNISIDDGGNSITVDYAVTGSGNSTGALRVELANNGTGVIATLGTITNVVHIDDNAGNLSIDDGGNSITVDYAVTGSGNSTGALRVELANNGTGVIATVGTITNVVHVDDNGGSLTVDNNGTFVVQADTELPIGTLLADATVNPTTPVVGVMNEIYNGATWDLMRGVTNSTNSTGTGIQAVGLVAQLDDTNTSTVAEDQFANLRLTPKRALLIESENDGYQRRLDEANFLENLKTDINTIVGSESENSQRMGYEIR
jgi:hypothetical protein